MRANFRHVCTTFTAEGPYTLVNDFLDDAGFITANNHIPSRISLAVIRPPAGAPEEAGSNGASSDPLLNASIYIDTATASDNNNKHGGPGDEKESLEPRPVMAPQPHPLPSTSATGETSSSVVSSLLDALPGFLTGSSSRKGGKRGALPVIPPTPSSSLSVDSGANGSGSGNGNGGNILVVNRDGAFVARTVTSEKLADHSKVKHTAAKGPDNVYLFFNIGNSFIMADFWGIHKGPMEKLVFNKSKPTCHDVNSLSRSPDRLEVIIGFTKGDILLYDPFARRQVRYNKAGAMCRATVLCIKWIPGSETQFVASFSDGFLMVFDTEREDAPLSIGANQSEMFHVVKSSNEKHNPVSCWQVGHSAINNFAFSPDCVHLATVGRDGCLRVFDFKTERLVVTFKSYFGGLLCVNWSPDGKYLITGGEDDLVSIWNFAEERLVARCEGHQSWVNDVAFDQFRCDEEMYRCGSVGEDSRLLLWDFSVNALNRPRSVSMTRPRSVSSLPQSTTSVLSTGSKNRGSYQVMHVVEALPMSEVPIMEPVVAKKLHLEPLSSIQFRQDAILTACRRGHVKVWARPDPNAPYSVDADET